MTVMMIPKLQKTSLMVMLAKRFVKEKNARSMRDQRTGALHFLASKSCCYVLLAMFLRSDRQFLVLPYKRSDLELLHTCKGAFRLRYAVFIL
mmetsp:Transcript_7806/g.17825  ORF Transcript_7806/g.17825 Transcript_7806/m.17825 type:complete len:92 (+) Transcript_7806:494-769(+)